MKQTGLTLIFLLLSALIFAQEKYQTTYHQLKEYEGIYEFVNHTSLSVAASPKDTLLYAIINKSNYALTPFAKDVFLNLSKEKIPFLEITPVALPGTLQTTILLKF